jgi:hypothetical protein
MMGRDEYERKYLVTLILCTNKEMSGGSMLKRTEEASFD